MGAILGAPKAPETHAAPGPPRTKPAAAFKKPTLKRKAPAAAEGGPDAKAAKAAEATAASAAAAATTTTTTAAEGKDEKGAAAERERSVLVRGVPPEATAAELRQLFSRYGKVAGVRAVAGRPALAIVVFPAAKDARRVEEITGPKGYAPLFKGRTPLEVVYGPDAPEAGLAAAAPPTHQMDSFKPHLAPDTAVVKEATAAAKAAAKEAVARGEDAGGVRGGRGLVSYDDL